MASPARELATELQTTDLDNRCSSASAAIPPTHHRQGPSRLEVFESLAWAKAYLVRFGLLDFLDAVDELQSGAEWSGLIEDIGQDAVHAVMAREFANV